MKPIASRKHLKTVDEDDDSRSCAEVCAYPLIEIRILLDGGRGPLDREERWPVRPCA